MRRILYASATARNWVWVLALASLVGVSKGAYAQAPQQELVTAAEQSLAHFINDPKMVWLRQNIGHAKAILIAPSVVKAGFIVGGSGGRAVLFARDPQTGQWVGPAFYNLATASVGFQAGVSMSETLALVMTDKGFTSLLADSFKLGPEASIVAGPVGSGASGDVLADFVAYSRSKGLYGGLNLDGTVISPANGWNDVYYQQKLLPPDILVRASAHNAQADRLVAALDRAAAGTRQN